MKKDGDSVIAGIFVSVQWERESAGVCPSVLLQRGWGLFTVVDNGDFQVGCAAANNCLDDRPFASGEAPSNAREA